MIAYQVMAHPSRMEMVGPLAKSLKAGITWDEKSSRWDTGKRAWEALADSEAEYGCVIQDDAVLCREFTRILPKALEYVPERSPVVLYAGTSIRSQVRHVKDASWLVLQQIIWGPGIVMPTGLIRKVLAVGEHYRIDNYDLRLSKWFERSGVPVYYTWPSLVEPPQRAFPGSRTDGRQARLLVRQPTGTDRLVRSPRRSLLESDPQGKVQG